ncbi:hypothetical protein F2Q68_00016578 [Brassica cretica]|uniref:Uncharacterized protein n=1 Tax=Brassica cretica TaxID=69181 RepID=A0A8S9HG06_BRACR|nr:hypothetical protein F2Q68_00016578 [Brassica cretica]
MDVFHKAKRSLLEDDVFHKENGKLPYVYLEDLKSKLKTWRRFGVTGVRWVLTYLVKYFRGGGRLNPRLRGSLANEVSLKRSVKIAAVEDSVLRCAGW